MDEGFSFDGIHYTSPFMFGPYWDFEPEQIGDDVWAKHPQGELRKTYVDWRDGFADHIVRGEAAAPEEFHEVGAVVGRKPGL
ncbi:hypothetical protein ACCS61_32600 [Rhizobium ruizarguesonis]